MDIKVLIAQIEKINPHPNAQQLEIVVVNGWQVVTKKNIYKIGQLVIHVPPEAMVPWNIAKKWGVDNYLAGFDNQKNQYEKAGRVKIIKLRGEVSHGFIVPNENDFPLGTDVTDFYGIYKYEEPEKYEVGLIERKHPLIFKYTDIQHLNNYPNLLQNMEVVANEKIHGTNSIIALAPVLNNPNSDREFLISSARFRRKLGVNSIYEQPLFLYEQIKTMMNDLFEKNHKVIHLYGEIYGNQVQNGFNYDAKNSIGYVAFDISINNIFLNYDDFKNITKKYNIPTPPEIYRGPFDFNLIKQKSKGNTLLGGNHIREGLVVRTQIEKSDPQIGRLIFKMVADDFNLNRKTK